MNDGATGAAGKGTSVLANACAGRHIECTSQQTIIAGVDRFDQHLTHTPARASNSNQQAAWLYCHACAHCLALSSGG